jgi:endoglucanase
MQRESDRRWWIVALATACGAPASTPESTSTSEETPEVPVMPAAQPSAPATPGSPAPAAAASPAPAVAEVPLPMDLVLDDFEDGDGLVQGEGFDGRWRTYSDGTGMVTPAPDTPVVAAEGAVHVTGSNFSTWGVGLAVDLDIAGEARTPVDLGAYRGLTIVAKGTGSIDVELVLPATTGTTESGGTCAAAQGCFGHYATTLTLSAEYAEHQLSFASFAQPPWALAAPLDLGGVLAIDFLSRASGAPVGIDLWVDSVSLTAPLPASAPGAGPGTVATVNDGSNPFAGRTLHSEGGAALGAYQAAQGVERELLGKVALNPAAYWLVGGDPGRAGSIVDEGGDQYSVLVAYNIPDRDCNGESQGGAGSEAEYQGWIDGIASSLAGKQAAVILEPDALALSCGESTERLISYAVDSLRQNPGVAVYIDGGHSSWVAAGEMANRLRAAGIERATGFAVNVSNFQPTDALINYGRELSGLLAGKPFVIDTSRNGRGARGAEWCNPAGAGLGEAPTTATGNDAVHAFLWVKRPGESDGSCGQCASTPAGQFCTSYALELAQNAVF